MSKDTLVSVKFLSIVDNSTSSIIQIGDRDHSSLYNQTMAVERNMKTYSSDEPYFESYSQFTKPTPYLEAMLPPANIEHCMLGKLAPLPEQTHTIEVGSIKVISSSQSSNIQLGNGRKLAAENRQKAFKQYYSPAAKRDADQ